MSNKRLLARAVSLDAKRRKTRNLKLVRAPRNTFNGQCSFTRSCSTLLNITAAQGWSFGAGNSSAIAIVFDPTSVNLFGSVANFATVNVPNAAEIAALWDDVFLYKVEITLENNTDAQNVSTLDVNMPRIAICNDYNDGQTGTTLDAILQHSDCQFKTTRTIKWTCYPKHQRLIYYSAVSSSYEGSRGYVNTGTAIPHYGVHLAMTDVSQATAARSNFFFKLFYKCRNTK